MKGCFCGLLALALSVGGVMAQSPLPVGSVTVAAPTTIAVIDMTKLKGAPSRMAWSPDGQQTYLQTIEGPFHSPKSVRHYAIDMVDGKVKDLPAEPDWFSAYWAVKSHKSSPDLPGTEIALSSATRLEKTTSVPRGGDLARGGVDTGSTGTSSEDAVAAASNAQSVTVHTMTLHGQTIGQFTNSVIVPGLTFAWAPKGSKAIAYIEPDGGRIVLMDVAGKRQAMGGTKDALLPMWSQDATQLAWLQKQGKKAYELKVVKVR